MESKNFEFLRECRPQLAELGAFAEKYANSDPESSLIKQRSFIEQIVGIVYDERDIPLEHGANLFEMMTGDVFEDITSRVILDKLHFIRKRGNKAAHGTLLSPSAAKATLRESYDVARWFHVTYNAGSQSEFDDFVEMPVSLEEESGTRLERENRALQAQLARKEQQLEELLASQEEARRSKQITSEPDAYALGLYRKVSDSAADSLQFDEAETRDRLIDEMLRDAGWNVGDQSEDTDQVSQEVRLEGFPTGSGSGFADYVLWGDSGEPLAVVEAKKTAVDPEAGRTQAKLYADCLEKMHGHRPVIFYTNGVDIFVWDDAQSAPPRKLYGFYAKDSLQYLTFQRSQRTQLELIKPSAEIAGRQYQLEAIKRVTERFSDGHRKALIVQATGTGKTRVAISICDVLLRAKWAKRILFLCDRRELRKQADQAFKEFLPDEPRVFVNSETNKDRDKRIYLATYPAMMKCFEAFDVGFFDLIISDESHRSIYNIYRDLFHYFDALEVGLTATPTNIIDHNTYQLFGCDDHNPTFHYSLSEAINHEPPYLVNFRVVAVTTKFQRKGIKYSQLSDEEKQRLEEQVAEADEIEHEASDIDQKIFNKDTSRFIIRNLMENGITDASGNLPGKTIVFARSQRHAKHLGKIFDELYPSYGGNFCRVITSHDPYASDLIDEFKDPQSALRIAISVDMLDTGIDVPEIVNLVFAKPVRSYVKFWQMIGRGTRLAPVPDRPSPDLFGPGEKKTEFLIFDHWQNFEYFDEEYEEISPPRKKSLMERLFKARIELLKASLDAYDQELADLVQEQILRMLKSVMEANAIEVRDYWLDLKELANPELLGDFAASTHQRLVDIAPLMRWINVRGHEHAYRFDLLIAETQTAFLRQDTEAEDLRGQIVDNVDALRSNLNQVKAKAETIKRLRKPEYWSALDPKELEEVRTKLRGIMQHKQRVRQSSTEPKTIDLQDGGVQATDIVPTFEGQDLLAYHTRVKQLLEQHFQNDPVLSKIRAGHAVSENDLNRLAKQILSIDPQVDIKKLPVHINIKGDLHRALRKIIGLDTGAVDAAFTKFSHRHNLTSRQQQFIRMLQQLIQSNGGLDIDRLWEDPFTSISAEGIDGVFADEVIDEILEIIARFEKPEITGAQ